MFGHFVIIYNIYHLTFLAFANIYYKKENIIYIYLTVCILFIKCDQ